MLASPTGFEPVFLPRKRDSKPGGGSGERSGIEPDLMLSPLAVDALLLVTAISPATGRTIATATSGMSGANAMSGSMNC
jgi:hypothetical protein